MNPVSSYDDIIEFLQYCSEKSDKLIPVFLIKPSTMLYLNREHFLEHIFDYFDRRSGDRIQFFLPGYAHYPDLAFGNILSNVRQNNKDAIALTTRRLGEVYYSEKDFIGFIETLEKETSEFIYRGDAELLLLKYITGEKYNLGRFDFSKIYRYNLSKKFYAQRDYNSDLYMQLRRIQRFLEDVIFIMHRANNETELIASISSCYNNL